MGRRLPLRVAVHFVGKPASGALSPAIADYAERIGATCTLELAAHRSAPTPRDEGRALLSRLRERPFVALDPGGRPVGSEGFGSLLGRALGTEDHTVRFVLGGASGLSPEVLQAAADRLSLSALTMSHDLARLVLLEQIYRALQVMTGSPYAR